MNSWQVFKVSADMPTPASAVLAGLPLPECLDAWRAAAETPVGTPFLISPGLEYDFDVNAFF